MFGFRKNDEKRAQAQAQRIVKPLLQEYDVALQQFEALEEVFRRDSQIATSTAVREALEQGARSRRELRSRRDAYYVLMAGAQAIVSSITKDRDETLELTRKNTPRQYTFNEYILVDKAVPYAYEQGFRKFVYTAIPNADVSTHLTFERSDEDKRPYNERIAAIESVDGGYFDETTSRTLVETLSHLKYNLQSAVAELEHEKSIQENDNRNAARESVAPRHEAAQSWTTPVELED